MSYYHNNEAYLRAVIKKERYNAEHGRHASFRAHSQILLDRQQKELHKIIVDRELENELNAILEEELV